ncbi:mechanosensitive ion channel protein MscS [Sphingomonas psychrotolerans]|uniref:Small-conductance mechanosensitive channel n=2 Tax=Sphingomonas psychrotolerans TaxID=1327635 RepID=A0A2K8MSP7_9SPHN|nr:mechanosensitive ion channel protein MscS [Sphingomonas psychrotolerans]
MEAQARTLFDDSLIWIESHWLNIAIAAGVAVLIVASLHAVRAWAMRLCQRGAGTANWYSVIGRALSKTGNFFIIMTALRLVAGYANPPQMVATTIGFLFTIAAVFQVAIWVRELIFGAIEHRTTSENYNGEGLASAIGIIRLLVSIVLFAIATVMVLSNVGVNVTGLVAGLGIGGIAIGLAAQGIFGDLIAALSIIFDRPFRVGQHIKYNGTDGTIEQIGLKSTRLRSVTGELRIISNRQLLDKEIQNFSDRRLIRFNWMLGVAYETPPDLLDRLPQILVEIAEACGARTTRNGFANFGPSTLDYEFIVEIDGTDWTAANRIRDKLATTILRRFAQEGIDMPYPAQASFTAAPDGKLIMPYPEVQPVRRVDKEPDET